VRCSVFDFVQVPESQREVTPEGFLRAPARIARVGVQVYSAGSLGLIGVPPEQPIRLYRAPEEVFARTAMDSFEGSTLTLNHPAGGQFVDADSWRRLAIGDVVDVRRDGRFVAATVTVRDADAVKLVQSGAAQLSCGYDFDLDMTPGTTPEGEQYDGRQTAIAGNHVAVVAVGRAGPEVRIADAAISQEENTKKKIRKKVPTVDAPRVEMPLVGRRAALARHVATAVPKSAAAAAGLKGRAAFISGHRHAGGSK